MPATCWPNNVPSGDPAMFSQLRSGAPECFLISGIDVLSALIPDAPIHGLGFAQREDRTLAEFVERLHTSCYYTQ